MNNKVSIDLSFYFRVRGAEVFGGENSIGYASQTHSDVSNIDFSRFEESVDAYADKVILSFAELIEVPIENIELISHDEFEVETADTSNVENEPNYCLEDYDYDD